MTAHQSTARQLLLCPLSLIWMYANVLHLDLVLLIALMVMPFLRVMIGMLSLVASSELMRHIADSSSRLNGVAILVVGMVQCFMWRPTRINWRRVVLSHSSVCSRRVVMMVSAVGKDFLRIAV